MTSEPSTPAPLGAAFFDLDRTLLPEHTGRLWVHRERARGHLSGRQVAEAGLWMGLYHLGLLRARTAFGRALASIAGRAEAEIDADTRAFFDEEVRERFAPAALEALARHRAAGEPCVLLSSTSVYLARCVAGHLGLDDILCMRYEVEDGLFTGRLVEPICYGEGKLVAAEAWCEAHRRSLETSAFYTDSITDLPALERVGRPVCVNPDPRLARVARKRGWVAVRWDGPGGEA